jgi:hypothetical protein
MSVCHPFHYKLLIVGSKVKGKLGGGAGIEAGEGGDDVYIDNSLMPILHGVGWLMNLMSVKNSCTNRRGIVE